MLKHRDKTDWPLNKVAVNQRFCYCFVHRGKTEGHDIDLLISHPEEGVERGVLVRLMEQLDKRGMVLQGSISHSTYTDQVLKSNPKSNLTTTLDHFEKWIGILKISKTLTVDGKSGREENASGSVKIKQDINLRGSNKKHTVDENAGNSKISAEHDRNEQIDNEESRTQNNDYSVPDVSKSRDINDTDRRGDITKGYDVIPPSCKRQLSSTGEAPEGDAAAAQDSLDLARPKFERRASLEGAFELSNSARDWLARRVDLIIVPATQYYYALVGWTGSKQYNR